MNSIERRTSMVERRPSMAERRSSMNSGPNSGITSGNGTPARRPTIIPYLAGIEKPTLPKPPKECDVLICGTGLVESILAAALAWQGTNVLHVDSNPYYGDTSSTLTIEQLKAWSDSVNQKVHGFQGFSNASLYIPRPTELISKDYSIDLTPRILFAKSDLLALLIKSRVYRYLEFQPLSNFHTFENELFGKIQSSQEEIFTDQTLSLNAKRTLMKFMKFVLDLESPENQSILEPYKNRSFLEFLNEKFNKLSSAQINELVFTLGLSPSINITAPQGLSRIRRYLLSMNVYGSFPALYSKYGGPGELSQGFCRSAAVAGAIYMLDSTLENFDPTTKIATFTDGSKASVSEKVICSPSQAPEGCRHLPATKYEITRMITIVAKSCKEWIAENESSAVVVFPPSSLSTNNKFPVQVIIMGSGSGCCPSDQCIWYLSTIETNGDRAKQDLEAALNKLEESILRESEDSEFDIELDDSDVLIKPDGSLSVINSVKLGKSFKEFIPKQKLKFLFKLSFTQYTAVEPFGVVNEEIFRRASRVEENEETDSKTAAPDEGIIYSNMPSTEISYDGIITEAKILYSKIVGSDDDFFDVDFEDEDEENNNNSSGKPANTNGSLTGGNSGNNSTASIGSSNANGDTTTGVSSFLRPAGSDAMNEEAIIDDDDEDDEYEGNRSTEFKDEMEFEL